MVRGTPNFQHNLNGNATMLRFQRGPAHRRLRVVLLRRLDREGQRRVPAGLRSLFAERSDARERFGDAEFLLQYA
jgi:hypothetical protein